MRLCSVLCAAFVVALLGAVPSPCQAIDRDAAAALAFEAGQSCDPEVLAAVRVLQAKGLLEEDAGSDQPRAPGLMAEAYAEASRRDREADLTLLIGQSMLDKCLGTELFRRALPPEIPEFALSLEQGALVARGRFDGPLFVNPRFEAAIRLQGVSANVFDVHVQSAKVLGLEVKRFSGLVYDYLRDTMVERLGAFAALEDRGVQPGGSYAIRVTVRPEAIVPGMVPKFVPLLKGVHLSRIEVADSQIRCYIRFGVTP